MADGIEVTAGSGTLIETDQLPSGKHAQVIKLADGTADSSTRIAAGAGVSANAIRTVIATDQTAVPVSLATTPGLTDTQLRASAVPVSGSVAVSNLPSTQAVTGTFWQATQPVSLASTPGLTDTQLRASAVPVSLGSGTNTIGGVTRVPSATQTMPSRARIASAASTNATSVKASAGGVYHIVAANMATSARFLKLYDKASAPTVGTDTPIATIYLPANGGFAELFDIPMGFTTGIAYAITALVADTDTTAVALNDIHGFILYA